MDNLQKPYGQIYRLTNKINGKMYHGQTIQELNDRWIKYKCLDCKEQPKLYRALLKYGPESFIYEGVDIAKEQIELNKLETFYIRKFDSMHNGYNCNEGGDAPGVICEETKRKISAATKGHIVSKETREKIGRAHKGRKWSEEVRNNMSLAGLKRKGIKWKMSDIGKSKISSSLKGKPKSEEARRKMSEAAKRRCESVEYRKILSERAKLRLKDPYTKQFISSEIPAQHILIPENQTNLVPL